MKVLKFGGTSVGTVESLLNVKKIVESIEGNSIIVVSALGGLTDKLIATAEMAAKTSPQWKEEMSAIENRHFNIIESVVPDEKKDKVKEEVSNLLKDLKRNYEGVALINDLPAKILDVIVSFGERMSSIIVAAMIQDGERHDSLNFIKTEKRFGKNIEDKNLTNQLIIEEFSKPFKKAIVPGFISTDTKTGEITNLGRGGSDFTGALIAAALNAEVLEIWTDVNGFMTADPRIVDDAFVVDHMSFTESMELCTFGAKVIYPPTIYPVFHKNIPIKILNTFNPQAPGTLITDTKMENDLPIKGVTALRNLSLITIKAINGCRIPNARKRSFNVLSKNGIRIIPVSNNEPEQEFSFAVSSADSENSLSNIIKEFAPEIGSSKANSPICSNNLSAIAVVGDNLKSQTRLAARIENSLSRDGIKVNAISIGNSDTTIAFIIGSEHTERALRLIHALIF